MEATDTQEPRSLDEFAESLLMPDEEEGNENAEAPDEDQTEAQAAEEADAEEEPEGDEPEGEDDDEREDEGEEQPEKLTVKVDGQDIEVTLEDLKRSYSGQAYIQKGMQEVAYAKKQAEAVYEALNQERAQVAQFAQQLQQGGIPQPPRMPSQELAQKDPLKYNAELGRYVQEREKYDRFMAQSQALTAQQSEAQQRAMQAHLAHQAELLKQAIPEFADPDKGGTLRQKLLQVGADYGFSQEELSAVTDFRTVQVLNDARKWRELQAGKQAATKKAEKARPVVRPGAKKANNPTRERDKLKQKLRQSGRIDDAVELLLR